ncbi:hypothetical protein FHS43_006233 [Streptosporangium becharense]|uniref:Uncharacterized protein n=1 Tax=Streptosporangium becharense TaxID=1816182 RepID=A0A7W9IHL6_9ACTN|nr:hypothetical protein [Streptosporangium becharense]MBB2914921.1 hypothetical protein [Streptosporangium becharense]MBB5820268.1 hypothetical protein [Streptosporangium becharense]
MQPPNEEILDVIQRRVRRITALSTWQERATSSIVTMGAELQQAQEALARAQELIVIQQRALGIDPSDPPPEHLVAAWRTGSPRYVPVRVEVDGADVTLIMRGPARAADPVREFHDWQELKRIWKEVHHEIRSGT